MFRGFEFMSTRSTRQLIRCVRSNIQREVESDRQLRRNEASRCHGIGSDDRSPSAPSGVGRGMIV